MALVLKEWKSDGYVFSVAASPDGSRAGVSSSNDLAVVDVDTGQAALDLLRGYTNWIRSIGDDAPENHPSSSPPRCQGPGEH